MKNGGGDGGAGSGNRLRMKLTRGSSCRDVKEKIHDLLLLGGDKVQPVKYAAARTASGLFPRRPHQDVIRHVIYIHNGIERATREMTLVPGSRLHYTYTVKLSVIMQPV